MRPSSSGTGCQRSTRGRIIKAPQFNTFYRQVFAHQQKFCTDAKIEFGYFGDKNIAVITGNEASSLHETNQLTDTPQLTTSRMSQLDDGSSMPGKVLE